MKKRQKFSASIYCHSVSVHSFTLNTYFFAVLLFLKGPVDSFPQALQCRPRPCFILMVFGGRVVLLNQKSKHHRSSTTSLTGESSFTCCFFSGEECHQAPKVGLLLPMPMAGISPGALFTPKNFKARRAVLRHRVNLAFVDARRWRKRALALTYNKIQLQVHVK
jgi:hypothetical protein